MRNMLMLSACLLVGCDAETLPLTPDAGSMPIPLNSNGTLHGPFVSGSLVDAYAECLPPRSIGKLLYKLDPGPPCNVNDCAYSGDTCSGKWTGKRHTSVTVAKLGCVTDGYDETAMCILGQHGTCPSSHPIQGIWYGEWTDTRACLCLGIDDVGSCTITQVGTIQNDSPVVSCCKS